MTKISHPGRTLVGGEASQIAVRREKREERREKRLEKLYRKKKKREAVSEGESDESDDEIGPIFTRQISWIFLPRYCQFATTDFQMTKFSFSETRKRFFFLSLSTFYFLLSTPEKPSPPHQSPNDVVLTYITVCVQNKFVEEKTKEN